MMKINVPKRHNVAELIGAMFTGIIEALGDVRGIAPLTDGRELSLAAPFAAELAPGESVAVNGACLTVVTHDAQTFRVQAGFETLQKTNLGELKKNDRINLERALRLNDRLGGHLVTGHVDGVGRILERTPHGEFELIWFSAARELTRQMAAKGSIAVDGISLTLVEVQEDRFSVMLIPHTLAHTTLGLKRPGDTVNLETDLLAKYVEKQLQRTPLA
jgi:riboflavin synthase